MKKNLVYAMMSAIALTSAVSFTGCASDDGASVDTNPTYDGKSVRTDFAFSITKASQGTRMSAATVQEQNQPFVGIDNMFLLPFDGEPGTGSGASAVTSTNAAIFHLGSLTSSDIYDATDNPDNKVLPTNKAKSSKVYSLTLPIGTDNFLFYGTAKRNSETDFVKGALTRSGLPVPTSTSASAAVSIDEINFALKSIQTGLGANATNIAAYLTAIANTALTGEHEVMSWKATTDAATYKSEYKSLADLYEKFTDNSHQPRAGSAEAVARTVLDLYKGAKKINGESSVTNVKDIADAICTSITGASGVKVKLYKPGATVGDDPVELAGNASDGDPDTWTAVLYGLTGDGNPNTTFPANLGLPMGAAQLTWVEGSTSGQYEFKYNDNPTSFLETTTPTSVSNTIEKYRYPAELIYFDNSPLRATDSYRAIGDFPVTADKWDIANADVTENNGFDTDIWNKSEVSASTRAVAMQNNVNYGVALLATTVKFSTAPTACEDNCAAILGGAATNQSLDETGKFKVTGLLIGGQPASVDWDMTNPDDDFKEVIYDNEITFESTALSTGDIGTNYTIVLDNYKTGGEDDQKAVLIALEIKNEGADFYGYNGLIPAGSTFYLLGTLDPKATSGVTGYTPNDRSTSPNMYRITKEDVNRVFVQDYKTTANIVINPATALKKAYNTIPDLRSTEIVFGLSVDMKWEAGYTFTVEI